MPTAFTLKKPSRQLTEFVMSEREQLAILEGNNPAIGCRGGLLCAISDPRGWQAYHNASQASGALYRALLRCDRLYRDG